MNVQGEFTVGVRGGMVQREMPGICPEGNLLCPSIIRGGISLWHKLNQATYYPTWQALMGANVMEAQEHIYVSVKKKSN